MGESAHRELFIAFAHGQEISLTKIVTLQVFSSSIVFFLCYIVGNDGIIIINSIDLS